MLVKKHSTRNEYIRAGDMWVRNFTKPKVVPLSLNALFDKADHQLVLTNELKNRTLPRISEEKITMEKMVIVSDGYHFQWKHLVLAKLPKDVFVLAVNRAMRNWKLMSRRLPQDVQRPINAYVVNNPYTECLSYLPSSDSPYYPVCIASARTNYRFLEKHLGNKYVYEPVIENSFGREVVAKYSIDDYRNPVCAAIGLAYRFGVKRLMLVSCDDSFREPRDSAVQLPNGLWTYPQQNRAHEIIDGNLFWLTHQHQDEGQDLQEVAVADWSDGLKYANAHYISNEEEAMSFFRDKEEGTSND